MAGVSLREVRKNYGELEVIHGVNAVVADGEFVVIVGPSGCGKSTLLRMVAGLERITSGEIAIGDRVVNELEPKDRDIAMVFQNYALYPHMSVHGNMAYGLKIRGMPREQIDARVQRAAGILELGGYLQRRPRELSGGQRQRVAMGRAIVREPAVFLFDEPLSNLDAKLRVQMRAELQALHRRLATTSLFVTHDQVEAMTLANRMIVMNAGRAEQIGAPLEVYAKPATTFVAGFIGSPPMNLIPGRLGAGGLEGSPASGGSRVRLPAQSVPSALAGREVLLGIRAEHFEPCAESGAMIAVDIDLVEPLGADTLVYGHLSGNSNGNSSGNSGGNSGGSAGGGAKGARVAARLHESVVARHGRLALRFDPARVHFFDPASGARIDTV
jgi:sn-glycerol 3-phosphate transport system ATP-binding protein